MGCATGPRTVQQMHMVLHQAFRRAVQLDLMGRNPADAVEPPRLPRTERPSLTVEQASALFTATRSDRMYALYVVLTTTGLRLGEALGLQWNAVDLNESVLFVRHALQRQTGKGFALEELKTAKGRKIRPRARTAYSRVLRSRLLLRPLHEAANVRGLRLLTRSVSLVG
jgi:integrase